MSTRAVCRWNDTNPARFYCDPSDPYVDLGPHDIY